MRTQRKLKPKAFSALTGFCMGLTLISAFVFTVETPNPDWSTFWQLRPLLITPLVAAFGAALSLVLFEMVTRAGLQKTLAFILASFVFLVFFWLGFILGLDETLWD